MSVTWMDHAWYEFVIHILVSSTCHRGGLERERERETLHIKRRLPPCVLITTQEQFRI
jgi:hypothetical protein